MLALLCYQWREVDGRLKTLKMCRGISERVMIEIILSIQSNTHVSSQLWSAVRARGCQFLGPAMQDDVLRLILMTLETGECIARKNLVMYVVQTLASDYPQVSKTCVGHVVQLLYRASCFNVLKRDGESSLMQLKEEFRTYESLRREHDSQIVQIAFESGLRIGPDQWSALLYADQSHRSHMQSIIDKLQSKNSYQQGVEELRALAGSQTSMLVPAYRYFLTQVIPCLEFFAGIEHEDTSMRMIGDALHQIRILLKLHCSQDDLRKMPKEERRGVILQAEVPGGMGGGPGGSGGAEAGRIGGLHPLYSQIDETGRSISRTNPKDNSHNSPQTPPKQPRQKRYQMGIPPNRMGYSSDAPPFIPSHQQQPPPQFFNSQHLPQRFRGGRQRGAPPPPPPQPMPMLIGYDMPGAPMMQATEVLTADGQMVNGTPQRVVIMQSPTHLPGGPVVMVRAGNLKI